MELGDFNYCRRAKNHVASQAYSKGIIMGGGRLDFSSNDEDEYPASWPDAKSRIQATYRYLGGFRREFEHPGGKQEDYCFHAQKAVGNSLKAWSPQPNWNIPASTTSPPSPGLSGNTRRSPKPSPRSNSACSSTTPRRPIPKTRARRSTGSHTTLPGTATTAPAAR